MCRPGMSPKDKTYKSIRNQNKIRLEKDVNSCSLESSFNQEPIGQRQLQGLKQEPGGQRLSRPLRASHFHPLTLCMCNACQHSCSLYKYHQPSSWKHAANGGFQGKSAKTKWDICYLPPANCRHRLFKIIFIMVAVTQHNHNRACLEMSHFLSTKTNNSKVQCSNLYRHPNRLTLSYWTYVKTLSLVKNPFVLSSFHIISSLIRNQDYQNFTVLT